MCFDMSLLARKNRPWTTFTTHNEHYEWTVIPFVLMNARQVFQRKMDNIFRK